jgi:hypothetical protein
MTDHDPTDDDLNELLEQFALQQDPDVDADRFRA